jgi:hypothetical protein
MQRASHGNGRAPRLVVERLEERCLLDAGSFLAEPVVPYIDPGMKASLQAVLARGIQMGNQPDVFAKVGDSITAFYPFLNELGTPDYDPFDPGVAGGHFDLAWTIEFFRSQVVDGFGYNSFDHPSWASNPGWRAADLLNPAENFVPGRYPICWPSETPLGSELRITRPAIALIMIGTNDLAGTDPGVFRAQLAALANVAMAYGVIPVLSTIPDAFFYGANFEPRVPVFNQVIADVAHTLDVPLWNYWLALQPLPALGISADGTHPSVYPGGSGVFTDQALQYGYNMRNLTAVEVLDKVKRVVLDNGAPDLPDGAPPPQAYQFVARLYQTVLGRPPDPASLQGWALATQVLPRQAVAQAIWESPEHRAQEVTQYYTAFLHRAPGAGEVAAWVGVFQRGASEDQVQAAVLASAEYSASHVSDESFVAGLYRDALGREPDSAGAAGWLGLLHNGMDRFTLTQWFLASSEHHDVQVRRLYTGILQRAPGPGEEQGWLTQLQYGLTTLEGIATAMLSSYEFLVAAH